ncbi:MAG: hypothetical protein IJO20_04865 [Ruminococcus sp.]|nr:hypothetical protein [Ruminococcus sp.]
MDDRLLGLDNETSFVDTMERESHALFKALTDDISLFDKEEYIGRLEGFLKKYKRIQYSSLSSLVYNSGEETRVTINMNLESLVNFTQTADLKKINLKDKTDDSIALYKNIIIKLWDHFQLAYTQMQEINRDDFYEKFFPERDEIYDSIKEEGRKLNKELISMVAIFTAMSFLIFGGLSSLSDILDSAIKELPIINISVVCLAWSLCVYNVMYLFMYLVGKLIDKRITSRDSKKFYKRHAVFISGNLILSILLLFFGWLYFAQTDLNGWYSRLYDYLGRYTIFTPLFLILFVLVVMLIVCVYRKIKKMMTKCYYVHKYNCAVIITDDAVYSNEGILLETR